MLKILDMYCLSNNTYLQGTLKDSLDRYSVYGLEENASFESNFKSEIEDVIKLVST